ncbi:CKLF-like MARVEL transmembrane domain-containing protein 8 [Belonocnema kinseyi]|uniref:CKLF-like MARVEL transmembrane domain-containing protein 8 n=1 Tax=Belonocnema kinseyi TaxID=2817044 RepID=UPI00143DE1E6|nr:CKLF-like MARVEL transmembrane domain-containing protein 8 [Belonocnema kinseyi]
MIGFWTTLILLALYIFHVVEKFKLIPWLKIELCFCGALSLFYFAAACVAASNATRDSAYGAGAFFGFCATVAYIYDAYLKFRAVKSGASPQGQHPSSKTVSTVASPAY